MSWRWCKTTHIDISELVVHYVDRDPLFVNINGSMLSLCVLWFFFLPFAIKRQFIEDVDDVIVNYETNKCVREKVRERENKWWISHLSNVEYGNIKGNSSRADPSDGHYGWPFRPSTFQCAIRTNMLHIWLRAHINVAQMTDDVTHSFTRSFIRSFDAMSNLFDALDSTSLGHH